MNDNIKATGHVQIYNAKTGKLLAENCNLSVDTGLNLFANLLDPNSGVTGINYCAIGTDNTAVASGQTQLVAETARKQISLSGTVIGAITFQTFLLSTECTYNIKEVGLFGNGATATANSGTMSNRALVAYDNSSSPVDLVIAWTITFAVS